MNAQAHISGQISGQVPNQTGSQLPVMPQHNGSALPPQMQNVGGPPRAMSYDPELLKARQFMQERICHVIQQRQPNQQMNERKFSDIVKRLEEGLLRSAVTKEDYMNLDTLESRLHNLIKRLPPTNQNQQYPQIVNSSSPVGTMIPTPGMSHSGNSNMMVTSSVDASMINSGGSTGISPTTVSTGNLLPGGGLHAGSFNRADGSMSNGYQQSPANFSMGSGGNMSSMGSQRVASQMIPTPGFNNSSSQSYMNLESSNNSGGFSTVDSPMVAQPQQQKQHISGQNSRMLHNLGSQAGSGIRSGLQPKSYGLSNGALNGGMGMIGNNLPLVNETGISESYLTPTAYANSSKPLQQHFDQHQRPAMQGDGYGMNNADSFGSGNYYGAATSVGSMMNPQSLNSVSLTPMSKTNSPLISNQANMHNQQQGVHVKPQQLDQLEKMNFQSSSSRDSILLSHQQHQFQQQPNQFQQQQQLVHHQRQQKQQNQQPQHE